MSVSNNDCQSERNDEVRLLLQPAVEPQDNMKAPSGNSPFTLGNNLESLNQAS